MPGGAVFLVAALLFDGAYGVWFYLSNQGTSLGDLVAPVPAALPVMVDDASSTSLTADPPSAAPAAPPAATPVTHTNTHAHAPAETARAAHASPEAAAQAPQTQKRAGRGKQ